MIPKASFYLLQNITLEPNGNWLGNFWSDGALARNVSVLCTLLVCFMKSYFLFAFVSDAVFNVFCRRIDISPSAFRKHGFMQEEAKHTKEGSRKVRKCSSNKLVLWTKRSK